MLSPAEFVNLYAQIGAQKAGNSTRKLYLSAVLAGFLIEAGAACCSPSG